MADNDSYQWSKSVNGEIYVVRAGTFEEYEERKANMIKHIGVEEFGKEVEKSVETAKPEPSTLTKEAVKEATVKLCPIHKEEMTGKEGKFGWFYSHKTDSGWCNGKHKEY